MLQTDFSPSARSAPIQHFLYPLIPVIMTITNSEKLDPPQSLGECHNTSSLRIILADISTSLEGITTAHAAFDERSEQLDALPSQGSAFKQGAEDVRSAIQDHEAEQGFILNNIEYGLRDSISRELETALYDQRLNLWSIIEEETADIVKYEVEEQIADFLPVSLQEVAEESRRQLRDIKNSLDNSHARMCNSGIEVQHLQDTLKPVLTANGERSPLYPQNVQALLGYDLPKVKALSKDYGLGETEDLQKNLQQFLKHIGTRVDVVSIPDDEGANLSDMDYV